jgi:hypothetical protein
LAAALDTEAIVTLPRIRAYLTDPATALAAKTAANASEPSGAAGAVADDDDGGGGGGEGSGAEGALVTSDVDSFRLPVGWTSVPHGRRQILFHDASKVEARSIADAVKVKHLQRTKERERERDMGKRARWESVRACALRDKKTSGVGKHELTSRVHERCRWPAPLHGNVVHAPLPIGFAFFLCSLVLS